MTPRPPALDTAAARAGPAWKRRKAGGKIRIRSLRRWPESHSFIIGRRHFHDEVSQSESMYSQRRSCLSIYQSRASEKERGNRTTNEISKGTGGRIDQETSLDVPASMMGCLMLNICHRQSSKRRREGRGEEGESRQLVFRPDRLLDGLLSVVRTRLSDGSGNRHGVGVSGVLSDRSRGEVLVMVERSGRFRSG